MRTVTLRWTGGILALLVITMPAWTAQPEDARRTAFLGRPDGSDGLGSPSHEKDDKKPDAKKELDPKKMKDRVKEIAGSAEFLRSVPKHFATLKAVDMSKGQVTLLLEGEVLPKVWSLVPDGEVKITGWWGRLNDLTIGDHVWVWFKTDRKKQAVAISMMADEISEQDIHGEGVAVEFVTYEKNKSIHSFINVPAGKEKTRSLDFDRKRLGLQLDKINPLGKEVEPSKQAKGARKQLYYFQSADNKIRTFLDKAGLERLRENQKALMRKRWLEEGLPGTAAFVHTFSGEMDLILDHETMRWARSLQKGDKVTLRADPPIKALVKDVQPWRERTRIRLVVNSFDLADLSAGQRLNLLREAPSLEVDTSQLPPDIDRPRDKEERVEWFLASIYCTCGVRGDRCTGHFYTLASCNPNGCAMPNHMRKVVREYIAQNMNDRQIFQALLKEFGPSLLRPHLLP